MVGALQLGLADLDPINSLFVGDLSHLILQI